MSSRALVIVTLFLLVSCRAPRDIIDRPIVFDGEREELTKQYIRDHYGLAGESIAITPKIIVLHWTVIPTLEGSFDAFFASRLPNWRPDIKNASGLNVSAHFLVDRDGTIYRLMPETQMARHVIGLNYSSIGVENVGGTQENPLTKAQQESNIWLVKYLAEKYPIEYLIGHYEYPNFEGHPLWLEKDAAYRTEKDDPGKGFMTAVRNKTKKFKFKPVPPKKPNDEN